MTIKAVLFDLGDTLWHFPKMPPIPDLVAQATQQAEAVLRRWGIDPNGPLQHLARDAFYTAQKEELDAYRSSLESPDPAVVACRLAAERGVELSLEQARELWETCRPSGRVLSRTLFPDTADTLRWVRQRGFRLGVVTNTLFGGPSLWTEFAEEGLDGYVEEVVASCDVGYMKPHPRIFQLALEALEAAPEETLMVGDSLRADVGGAKALGMTAVWKRRTDALAEAEMAWQKAGLIPAFEPDYVIDRLWELTELSILNHD